MPKHHTFQSLTKIERTFEGVGMVLVPVDLSADHPNDTPNIGLYVGVAGALIVDDAAGQKVTIANAPVGYHPICVRKVYSTANGTLATDIVIIR